jgi:hypothetical protein
MQEQEFEYSRFEITINNKPINNKSQANFLSILLDSALQWN